MEWTMDIARVNVMEHFAPRLTHLTIDPPAWETDAFIQLLQWLTGPEYAAPSITHLEISLAPSIRTHTQGTGRKAVTTTICDIGSNVIEDFLVKKNPALKHITFR